MSCSMLLHYGAPQNKVLGRDCESDSESFFASLAGADRWPSDFQKAPLKGLGSR